MSSPRQWNVCSDLAWLVGALTRTQFVVSMAQSDGVRRKKSRPVSPHCHMHSHFSLSLTFSSSFYRPEPAIMMISELSVAS